MNDAVEDQLLLARELTARVGQLCRGLATGDAEIFERVTPVTAQLLRWWFGEACTAGRSLNFHAGQRQAILNTIVAHEVFQPSTLQVLYESVVPASLMSGARRAEVSRQEHAHPKYCLKLAPGAGRIGVLQALLIWQILNRSAALDEGRDDPRFTHRFLFIAPRPIGYERLLDALCGQWQGGGRDFSTAGIAACADLFVPESHREHVFDFMHASLCSAGFGPGIFGDSVIAIADGRRSMPDFLAALPDLMVFIDDAHQFRESYRNARRGARRGAGSGEAVWQQRLSRMAASKGRRFARLDFSALPYDEVVSGGSRSKHYFPHIIVDAQGRASSVA